MKRVIKYLINFIEKYKTLEIIGLLITILYTIAVFLAPYASRYLIDDVLTTNSYEKLYYGILIFFVICIAQPLTGYVKDYIFLYISELISLDTRNKLFSKVVKAPLMFFDKTSKGEIISRIVNDGRQISDFVTNIFIVLIKNIILLVMVIVGMLILSPLITSIVIMFFLVYFIINIIISKKFEKLSSASLVNFDQFCTNIDQTVDNIVLIKTFMLEKHTESQYVKLLNKIYKNNMKTGKLRYLLDSLSSAIVVLSLTIIYGLGAILIMKHQLTIGTVVALGLYFQIFVQPIQELMNSNIKFREVVPIVERLNNYLYMQEEKNINPIITDMNSNLSGTNIEISNLCFDYQKDLDTIEVLHCLNMAIDNLGFYGIVGNSGSGKSTIAKILLGMYMPQKGQINICINGHALQSLSELRANISYVSQEVEMFNMSIRQNLLIGNPTASEEEIIDVCKKLNIHNKIISLPNGYEDVINEKINLSGGEKQRLSIARAYLKNATINIFDEITSSLDKSCEDNVDDIIHELSEKSIVIFITHKLQSLVDAKRIFVLHNGKIVQQGTHQELSSQIGVYQTMLQTKTISEEDNKYEINC